MSRIPELKITHKGLILVAVPLVFELVFVGVLVLLLRDADADVERELKAKTITQNLALLNKNFFNAATDVGGFNLSRSSREEEHFAEHMKLMDKCFENLSELFSNDPQRKESLLKLQQDAQILRQMLMKLKLRLLDAPPGMSIMSNTEAYKRSTTIMGRIGKRMEDFMEPELVVASEISKKRLNDRNTIARVIWVGIALNVLIAVLVALYFGRSVSSRINVMIDNTFRFAKAKPLNTPLEGDDEIAHLDAAFHEVVEHLLKVDEMKKEFLAVVSHDLKSPLTSVQGTLTLMTSGILGPLSEKAQSRLEDAELDVGRLINLINDLLDTELLDSGEFVIYPESISVERVIERSVVSVKAIAEKKQVSINCTPTAATPLMVHADEERLVQVFINLLSNAIKFSEPGSSIDVGAEELDGFTEFSVADRGRGVPTDKKEQIFERFKQVERKDSSEKGGKGLGLFICRRIVEAHHGIIGVESEEGKGSKFWFRIPKAESKQS